VTLLISCILAASVLLSMLGQGGGSLYTPIQVWLGVDFHEAATTSLFLIVVTSLSSSLVYHKADRIDFRMAIVLESVTAAGALAGGVASEQMADETLMLLLAVVLAVGAYFMIRSPERSGRHRPRRHRWFTWQRTLGERTYQVNMAVALPGSFVAGLLSGLLGVGGGILKVPMMVLLLGIPMDIAVGSSALMVGVTAGGGFAGHVAVGHWNWQTSLILGAAVFVGAQVGSRISVGMAANRLRGVFGWFLVAIATSMAATALL